MPVTARFDHIVWDWNGTLLDDTGFCVDIMNAMLKRRGLPAITLPFYRSILEFPVVNYYRKLGFDFSEEPFERTSDEYVSRYQAGWRGCALQPDTTVTLAALRDAGIGQSVLSASLSEHLVEQLDFFGVSRLLTAVTGADNHHGRGKLTLAKEHTGRTGAEPRRILFIGDTAHDAEVANEAGCQCLLVSFGHYGAERLRHLGWPVADSMAEVLRYIINP